jgi:hypothetical protein
MTAYIVKRWHNFGNFIALFTTKLSKPAQRHLVALLIAFISYDGRKNVAGLNRALFAPCHSSSLNRFLSEGSWSASEFEQKRLDYLDRKVRRYLVKHTAKGQLVNAFLCIDDTNNPKTGLKAPGTAYQYSHLAGSLIRCYCLVTGIVLIGPYVIPLTFQLYQPTAGASRQILACPTPSPSKIELAQRLIQAWQPPVGTRPFVLADSWYICDQLFSAASQRGFTLLGGLKANRLVSTTPCPKLTALSSYASKVPKSAYQMVTLAKQRFCLAGIAATLKGGRQVKLVIAKSLANPACAGAGIKRYTYRYFVSSDPHLGVQELAELYSVRWEIETFHAHLKQLLGLDHSQCWSLRSLERMWSLILIAYTYLMLEAVENGQLYGLEHSSKLSLGQVVIQHKREAHRAQAEWVYDQTKAGQSLQTILQAIAA